MLSWKKLGWNWRISNLAAPGLQTMLEKELRIIIKKVKFFQKSSQSQLVSPACHKSKLSKYSTISSSQSIYINYIKAKNFIIKKKRRKHTLLIIYWRWRKLEWYTKTMAYFSMIFGLRPFWFILTLWFFFLAKLVLNCFQPWKNSIPEFMNYLKCISSKQWFYLWL